jgi:hypothetical protein
VFEHLDISHSALVSSSGVLHHDNSPQLRGSVHNDRMEARGVQCAVRESSGPSHLREGADKAVGDLVALRDDGV